MTAITASNVNRIRTPFPDVGLRVGFVKAGADITRGQVVTSDSNTAAQTFIPIDTSVATALKGMGMALESCTSGNYFLMAMPGSIITGFDLNPTTTATHRIGSFVYTADSGGLDDTQATDTHRIGIIVRVSNDENGILIDPEYTLGV